ncbi:MAG: response regulator, partial [bacterium]
MEPKVILAVDDEPWIRRLYKRMFSERPEEYNILLASDGKEALEVLSKEPCDCMILDLHMPGMDGFEVLK